MKVLMIGCDNPVCNATAEPEWVSDNGRQRTAPYGWIEIKSGQVVGHGPELKGIEVCSIECLALTVEERIRENLS
jgi:hypothetical protein